jgi:hypothetical protein
MTLLVQYWPHLIVVGTPLVTGAVSSLVHYRRGDL